MDLPSIPDFENDLGDYFAAQLTAEGYAFSSGEGPWKLALLFSTTRHRVIPQRSRIVQWSTELRGKILDASQVLALQTIEAESLAGMDLNDRLSRSQKNAEFHDNIFNDWGILHMHLGAPGGHPGGFSGSTSELLFVMVRDDIIYFVNLLDHKVFADSALLEVVHNNWPKLIEHARAPDLSHLRLQSPEDRKKLRKAGAVVATELSDGTVYIVPGGGYTMTGANLGAVLWVQRLFTRVTSVHEWCVEHTDELVRLLQTESGVELKTLRCLHIRLKGEVLSLVESTTGAEVNLDFGGHAGIEQE